MTTKTLKLNIDSSITGEAALKNYEKTLKGIGATVDKFTTTSKVNEEGLRQYNHTVTVATDNVKAYKAAVQGIQKESLGMALPKLSGAEDTRMQKARKVSAGMEAEFQRRVKLEKLIVSKGVDSLIVLREQAAQRELSIKKALSRQLLAIDQKVAQGGNTNTAIKDRWAANKTALREIIALQTKVTAKEREQAALAEKAKLARQASLRSYRTRNSLLKSARGHIVGAAHAQRNWTLQVAEGIGLYRTISFLLGKVKQGLLEIPKAGIALQSGKMALTGIFGSEGAEEEMGFVSGVAAKYGLQLSTLRTSYTKFAASAMLAGASLKEVHKTFEDFSAVGAVLHKTSDEMASIFLALDQMYAKGVVQSEEVKKQLGNQLPGAVEVAAHSMEMLPAAFMEAMRANEVIASEAVPKIAAKYRELFAPEAVVASLANQMLFQYNTLVTRYTLLNEALFAKSKDLMTSFLRVTSSSVAWLTENLDAVTDAAKVFTTYLLVRGIPALVKYGTTAVATAAKTGILTKSFLGFKLSRRQLVNLRVGMRSLGRAAAGAVPYILGTAAAATALTAGMVKASSATLTYAKRTAYSAEQEKALTKELQDGMIAQGFKADFARKAAEYAVESYDKQRTASKNWLISYKGDQVSALNVVKAAWGKITTFTGLVWDALAKQTELRIAEVKVRLQGLVDVVLQAAQRIPAGLAGIFAIGKSLINGEGLDAAMVAGDKAVTATLTQAKKGQGIIADFTKKAWQSTVVGAERAADAVLAPLVKAAKEAEDAVTTAAMRKKVLEYQAKMKKQTEEQAAADEASARAREKLNNTLEAAQIRRLRLSGELLKADLRAADAAYSIAITRSKENKTWSEELEGVLEKIREIKKASAPLEENKRNRDKALSPVRASNAARDTSDLDYLRAQTTEKNKYIKAQKESIAGMEKGSTAQKDALRELTNYEKTAVSVGTNSRKALSEGLEGSFKDFITGAKSAGEAMKGFALSILDSIASILANQMATSLVKGIFGGSGGWLETGLNGIFGSSKGNVFSGGRPQQFAKGGIPDIGNKEAFFPMAGGGLGSLRENNKPEAIMPLERNSAGQLGVIVTNNTSSGSPSYSIVVYVDSSKGESGESLGGKIGQTLLKTLIKQEISEAARSGNSLNPTSAFA